MTWHMSHRSETSVPATSSSSNTNLLELATASSQCYQSSARRVIHHTAIHHMCTSARRVIHHMVYRCLHVIRHAV